MHFLFYLVHLNVGILKNTYRMHLGKSVEVYIGIYDNIRWNILDLYEIY